MHIFKKKTNIKEKKNSVTGVRVRAVINISQPLLQKYNTHDLPNNTKLMKYLLYNNMNNRR